MRTNVLEKSSRDVSHVDFEKCVSESPDPVAAVNDFYAAHGFIPEEACRRGMCREFAGNPKLNPEIRALIF